MSDAAREVGSSDAPARALIARLAEGLRSAGFTVVDVKESALLVEAAGTKLMIGVQATK